MRKLAILILASLTLLSACIQPVVPVIIDPGLSDDVVSARFDTVGALVTEQFDQLRPYCSGVFVNGMFVTAAHCVIDSETEEVTQEVLVAMHRDFDDEQSTFTRTWRFWPAVVWDREDVAVLIPASAASRLAHGSARVATNDLVRGQEVEVYGHPRGYLYYFARGQVVTPLRHLESRPFTLINAAGYPGMSGGPVFNTDGEIVGLVSFGWWGQSHIQGIVTRSNVERAVEQARTMPRHHDTEIGEARRI